MTIQFELESIHFLQQSKVSVTAENVKLLANDLQAVASEPSAKHEGNAYLSAMELKRRIGGYQATLRYLLCLK